MPDVEEDVRRAWRELVVRRAEAGQPWVMKRPELDDRGLAEAWEACVEVRDGFAAHFGLEDIARRFAVPEDYAAYMRVVGGGFSWPYHLDTWIHAAPMVAGATTGAFELLVTGEDAEPLDYGLWLTIGTWSDKHEFLLVCNRTRRFWCRPRWA